jgi:hypothetical protein
VGQAAAAITAQGIKLAVQAHQDKDLLVEQAYFMVQAVVVAHLP